MPQWCNGLVLTGRAGPALAGSRIGRTAQITPAAMNASRLTRPRAAGSPVSSATKPMTGGPASEPVTAMLDTTVIAGPATSSPSRPAAENVTGITADRPRPRTVKPQIAATGFPISRARAKPAPATAANLEITRSPPHRATNRSPSSRPAAMARA